MHILDAALISNLASKRRAAPESRIAAPSPSGMARALLAFTLLALMVSTLGLASRADPAPLIAQADTATSAISGLSGISGERSKLP
ncbi:MAG: hypothetical protein AB7I79_01345 [Rhizobiaceae bacterium]